jgi:hypothetical protein
VDTPSAGIYLVTVVATIVGRIGDARLRGQPACRIVELAASSAWDDGSGGCARDHRRAVLAIDTGR